MSVMISFHMSTGPEAQRNASVRRSLCRHRSAQSCSDSVVVDARHSPASGTRHAALYTALNAVHESRCLTCLGRQCRRVDCCDNLYLRTVVIPLAYFQAVMQCSSLARDAASYKRPLW